MIDVATRPDVSAFSRQFDSRVDRANSDFDQRQNFTFYSIWDAPAWRGPHILRMALSRLEDVSVGRFSRRRPVHCFCARSPTKSNREQPAEPAGSGGRQSATTAVAGGRRLLSTAAFGRPVTGQLGNLGRNSFRGRDFIT